jgi:hypothetical protein
MSFLLGILVVAKGLALVSGLFVLSSGSHQVQIAPPSIVLSDSTLLLSTQVTQPMNDDLRALLKSGLGIPLELTLDFFQLPEPGAINNSAATRVFSMDVVTEKYFVVNEAAHSDTLWAGSLREGLEIHGRFKDLLVAHAAQIQKDRQYQIVLTAHLKKVNMKALGGKELDLMKFWDYQAAQLKTDAFYGSELIQ